MEFDLSTLPEIVQQAAEHLLRAVQLAQVRLLNPAVWMQFGLLVLACLLAFAATLRICPGPTRWPTGVIETA